MENKKDIRWKQRFQNFEKAFFLLERTVKKKNLTELEQGGLIQFYEITFELAWKTLKDYLEANNVISKFPRNVIKNAFQAEVIDNGEMWIKMLDERNLMAHIYSEENIKKAVNNIYEKYFAEIKKLYKFLKNEH